MYSAYPLIFRLKSPHFDGKRRWPEVCVFDVYKDRKCFSCVSGPSGTPVLPVGNLGPRPVLGSIPGLYCIFCLPVFDTFLIPRPTFYALSISATRNYFWSMDRAGLGPRISTSISWPLLGPRSWAMQGITLPLHARKCPHTTSPKQLQKLVLVLKT